MDEKLTSSEESRVNAAMSLSREGETKKDHAAAKGLPALYESLAKVREMLASAKAAPEINAHTVHMTIGADAYEHKIADKKAFAEHVIGDLKATEAMIAGKIKSLGFDPG